MLDSIDLFISCAPQDEPLRDELSAQLSLLSRRGVIRPWHDGRVHAGDDEARRTDEQLRRARIVLLLVSPDFLASDRRWERELSPAIEQHAAGRALVIPIIARPCDWTGAPFAHLRVLPRDGNPVTRWPDRDEAWRDVVAAVREAAESLAPAPPPAAPINVDELVTVRLFNVAAASEWTLVLPLHTTVLQLIGRAEALVAETQWTSARVARPGRRYSYRCYRGEHDSDPLPHHLTLAALGGGGGRALSLNLEWYLSFRQDQGGTAITVR